MSGFKVDVEALRAFDELISDCRFDARMLEADVHSLQSVGEYSSGMLYADLADMHDKTVYPRVQQRMAYVETCLELSRDEVTRTADHYKNTNNEQAARMDAQYPGADSKPLSDRGGEYGPPKTYDDAFGPYQSIADYLDDPTDMDALEPKAHAVVSGMEEISEKISPFYWARRALTELCGGYDAFGEGFKALGGDWEGWATAALKWRDYGKAYEALAENVYLHHGLDYYWQGNAADAARAYFDDVTKAIEAEVPFYLKYLYPNYKKIVETIYRDYKAVEFLYGAIIDAIATYGFSLIASSSKIATYLIKLVSGVADILGGTAAGVNSVIAGMVEHKGPGEPPCLIAKSKFQEGYDHPGAK